MFQVKNKSGIWHLVVLAPLAFFNSIASGKDAAPEKPEPECAASSTQHVTESGIAREAGHGCIQLSAKDQVEDFGLPHAAFEKLAVNAGFGWGIFSGTLYNGNSDYAVTRITVHLAPTEYGKPGVELAEGREYDVELNLPPLSKTALSMPIPSDSALEYSWKITKARGYKMH